MPCIQNSTFHRYLTGYRFTRRCVLLLILAGSACTSPGDRMNQGVVEESTHLQAVQGSPQMQAALEKTRQAISCPRGKCGLGVRRIGTDEQAYLDRDLPLASWSAIKLYMVAAYIQRALELNPQADLADIEQRMTPCGNRLIDDIYFTLVQSYNPNPACILKDMTDRDPDVKNALRYVTSFTDPARLQAQPRPAYGNRIPGFDLHCWAPEEGGPSHFLAPGSSCPTNRLSPGAAVDVLNSLWSRPQFAKTREKMTLYLTERNQRLANQSTVFQQWPVLHQVLRKPGAYPANWEKTHFYFSEVGIMRKSSCLFAYSYFSEESIAYAEGVRNRFLFLDHLHANLTCAP